MLKGKISTGIPVVFLALIAVLGITAGALALWWESLTIDVTVNTGYLEAQLSVHGFGDNETEIAEEMGEPDPSVKNVSSINCTLSDDNKTVTIVINNAYPSISYWCEIDLKNTGTIPFKVYNITFEGNLTEVADKFEFTDGTIYAGLQLEPDDEVIDKLVIHLTNNAEENVTYTGKVTIIVEQWNEYPTPPPTETGLPTSFR